MTRPDRPRHVRPRHAGRPGLSHREPRAHWVLLLLGMVLLLIELGLHGAISHVGAEGIGPPPAPPSDGAPPQAVLAGAGPVLRLDPDGGVTSRSMDAGIVALTFDDGPDPQWTPQILDVLAKHKAHATFFVIGSKVNEHPDLVRRIVAEGHELGVHTFTHTDLRSAPAWRRSLELTLSQNAIAGVTGRLATLMRPPYSSEPDAVIAPDLAAWQQATGGSYLVVLSDHDSKDWQRPGAKAIAAAATPAAGRGAVVLMHDGGGDRSQTVQALAVLLPELAKRKARVTTVSAGVGLPAGSAAEASRAVRLRGEALRWAQLVSGWLAGVMTVVLGVAVALAVLRLLVQIVTARVHVRRARRNRRQLMHLGPVTVIMPAFNEEANIAAAVRSVVASDYPHVEVIVVDDGSTDDTARIVHWLGFRNVRLLRQANAGKAAALNTGIAQARTSLVVLVDGDTVLERSAVGRIVQAFQDSDVGAVSGNAKVANRRGLLGRWQHLEYVMGFNLDRRMFEVGECMPTVPGAIGAFRREALIDIGGVPTVTLAEDTDLTMALARAGWRIVYEETALAWTEAPSTLRQLWRQRYRWCYGTMQAMWRHRHALVEQGRAGKLGRRGLGYLLGFQVLLPLAAPAVDVYAIYGFLFLPWREVAAIWLGLLGLQLATAAYALRLDRESLRPLWVLPLQQVVLRQLMYLVVVQSTVTALTGIRLRWHRVERTGAAQEALGSR